MTQIVVLKYDWCVENPYSKRTVTALDRIANTAQALKQETPFLL